MRSLARYSVALVAAAALAGCTAAGAHSAASTGATSPTVSAPTSQPPAATPRTSAPVQPKPPALARAANGATPVHIQLAYGDGNTFGVGMPLIAYFSAAFDDARVLQAATTVTAGGKPLIGGRWYFERVWNHPGYPIEGDYRLDTYWPAHAQIRVDIAARGLYAGPAYGFDNSLTSEFTTGPAHLITVDGATHILTLRTDGRVTASYPVALGKPGHATLSGVKVIMEKVTDTEMKGQGYDVPDVKWDERLTAEGEYLHAAPWNIYNIEHGIDSSHGCTNLRPDDALALYNTLRVGDVVNYVHIQEATTPMTMGDGYGDWDVPWQTWSGGGAIHT